MTHMIVNINESGRNVEVRDIHNLPALVRGNIFFHGSDLVMEDADVAYFIDVIGRVNYVAALQQQVITNCLLRQHYDWRSDDNHD